MLDTASCGLAGDGVIAVLPVEKFFKIRDKAEGIL
jgi:nitrogen regulatory protein PII